jgi:hypothetical protein
MKKVRGKSFCTSTNRKRHALQRSEFNSKDDLSVIACGHDVPRLYLKPAISLQSMSDDEECISLKLIERMHNLKYNRRGFYNWLTQSNVARTSKILCLADQETYMLYFLEPLIGIHKTTENTLKILRYTLNGISCHPLGVAKQTRETSITTASSSTLPHTSKNDSIHSRDDEFAYRPLRMNKKRAAIVKSRNCAII